MKKWKNFVLVVALYVALWLLFCVALLSYTLKSLSLGFLVGAIVLRCIIIKKLKK